MKLSLAIFPAIYYLASSNFEHKLFVIITMYWWGYWTYPALSVMTRQLENYLIFLIWHFANIFFPKYPIWLTKTPNCSLWSILLEIITTPVITVRWMWFFDNLWSLTLFGLELLLIFEPLSSKFCYKWYFNHSTVSKVCHWA